MAQKAKKNFLILRVSNEEKAEYEELATTIYNFRDTSEFMRHALEHIKDKKPVLGKSFAPAGA